MDAIQTQQQASDPGRVELVEAVKKESPKAESKAKPKGK